MKARDFCFWLQGFFEIEGAQPRPAEYAASLNSEQVSMIRRHLALVFKHEIDPSMGGPEHQAVLNKTHAKPEASIPTSVPLSGGLGGIGPGGIDNLVFRC